MSKFNTKNIIIGVGLLILLSIGGYAAWSNFLTTDAEITVLSQENGPLSMIVGLQADTLETSNSSQEVEQIIQIKNENGLINMTVDYTITKQGTNIECTDIVNDCSVIFSTTEEGVLNPGDVITMEHGINNISMNTVCERFSCPQTISAQINMT